MNGVHDMGGMQGMGPVVIERGEPVFHAEWEKRVFAARLACGWHRRWNIDLNRHAIERMPPAAYLAASYYEKVLFGLETLLVEGGVVSAEELASGRSGGRADVAGMLDPDGLDELLRNRIRARRSENVAPRHAVGDSVVARNAHPAGHTRLPRYVRGHVGTVVGVHGAQVFADAHAAGRDEAQWLFTVEFSAAELWGPQGDARDRVSVDAWAPYLEAA